MFWVSVCESWCSPTVSVVSTCLFGCHVFRRWSPSRWILAIGLWVIVIDVSERHAQGNLTRQLKSKLQLSEEQRCEAINHEEMTQQRIFDPHFWRFFMFGVNWKWAKSVHHPLVVFFSLSSFFSEQIWCFFWWLSRQFIVVAFVFRELCGVIWDVFLMLTPTSLMYSRRMVHGRLDACRVFNHDPTQIRHRFVRDLGWPRFQQSENCYWECWCWSIGEKLDHLDSFSPQNLAKF